MDMKDLSELSQNLNEQYNVRLTVRFVEIADVMSVNFTLEHNMSLMGRTHGVSVSNFVDTSEAMREQLKAKLNRYANELHRAYAHEKTISDSPFCN